ncbi:MAG: helix-turn-helix transcriptional regulator [Verrucomicrobiaceae bacterium]|nr:helix-turn-helix transcriptional regulator [Verrucomicrobiaceae bacterium]
MTTTRTAKRRKSGGAGKAPVKTLTRWDMAANLEVKALREEHHLTMQQAAARCGLTRPAMSQHEHQQRGMTLCTAAKIARGYQLKGPDFFIHQARRWLPALRTPAAGGVTSVTLTKPRQR